MNECPDCEGRGFLYGIACTRQSGAGAARTSRTCQLCSGTGGIDEATANALEQRRFAGTIMRMNREVRGLTLRQEAERLGISAYELSRKERGEDISRPGSFPGSGADTGAKTT